MFEQEDGSLDGFCYSCGTFVADPLGKGKTIKDIPEQERTGLTKQEIAERLEFIGGLGCVDLKERRLRKEALEYYGIKVGYSEADGVTPEFVHFPYTEAGEVVRYKTRLLSRKSMWSTGTSNNVDLFGWEQAVESGARRLIITEGEYDAVALRRMLVMYQPEEYKDNIPAVCSLPNGAGNAGRDLARLAVKIRKHFKEVTLCFDDDEAGEKAVEAACKVLPEATTVTLPCKDANDCIKKSKGKAVHKAVMFNTQKPKNTRLVWGYEVHEEARKPAEWGLSTPWKGLTDMTRGFRFGETWYIAAAEKMGKSEVVDSIIAHLIGEHELKVLAAKPEQANNRTYKMVVSKLTGKVFHDPKIEFDNNAYDAGGAMAKNHLCMLNLYQSVEWETLKVDIRAAVAAGVKAVFIDPITNLTNGMSSNEADAHLKLVAQEAAAMALDLDIIIFFFCHLNKPAKGATPWDRGGKITTDYFAGSSAMARSCNYALGLQGNKDPELTKEEQNMRELVMLADREFGESGSVKLYWDDKTHLFNEV